MIELKTLTHWNTMYSADSVEWCPIESQEHLFVCGTYQLAERGDEVQPPSAEPTTNPPLRQGRLYLLSIVDGDQVIKRLQAVDMPAILDCKWAPQKIDNKVLLSLANAVGQIHIYKLVKDEVMLIHELQKEAEAELPREEGEPDLLTLSLDWSITGSEARIATSNSKGRISIFLLDHSGLTLEHNWVAHQFEAWIVHFDSFNPTVCYTGGDDSKLRVYDLRSDLTSAKLTNSTHSAGVTSLTCSRKTDHLLLSGSYDEQLLHWDTRHLKRPVNSVSLGGGVWRLRWRPNTEHLILAACMYNGFHILDQNLGILLHENREHESIVYGADWSHLGPDSSKHFSSFLHKENTAVIGTCSFYDHKLCIHKVDVK